MEESHVDDYTRILPVFLWGDENTAGSIAGDMETAIQKATKVITLHSITVKPEFKQGPQSEKQKAFYARNEYNKFVPENYLLMGKAYLFRNDLNLALEVHREGTAVIRRVNQDDPEMTQLLKNYKSLRDTYRETRENKIGILS